MSKKLVEIHIDGGLFFEDGRELTETEWSDFFIDMIEEKGLLFGGSISEFKEEECSTKK